MSLEEQVRVQTRFAGDPVFLYHLGRKLNQRQRFGEALPILERAAAMEPDGGRVRDEWAQAQMGTGQPANAYAQLRQFAGSHPDNAGAHFYLGKFFITQNAYGLARKALERSVGLDAKNAEAWSLLAHARIKMGAYSGAQEALEQAIRLRPGGSNDHLQLAVVLASRDPERARREFERAIELAPTDAVPCREYGLFLLKQGDAAAAERWAREALKRNDKDPLVHLMLGRSLVAQGRTSEALPAFEEAARLAPEDPNPPEALRRIFRQVGDAAKAADWEARYTALQQSVEERRALQEQTLARPGDRDARRRYAAALAKIGDAIGCLRQHAFALKTVPENPRAMIAAADDLNRSGYPKEALTLARRAVAQSPMNPEAMETLADTFLNLGRLHEAGVCYDRLSDWRKETIGVERHRPGGEVGDRRLDVPVDLLLLVRRQRPIGTPLQKQHRQQRVPQAILRREGDQLSRRIHSRITLLAHELEPEEAPEAPGVIRLQGERLSKQGFLPGWVGLPQCLTHEPLDRGIAGGDARCGLLDALLV
jgi:tetratricopeptide (TPR) repeat protein